ncbi:hypothetical protein AB0J83_41345 [Actinoplanes sp. NPDC049596]|uniref:hypothetical protein n=1 Tax=unclassified Actinoplanes TaxID=2626549 RepID=UPI00342280C1
MTHSDDLDQAIRDAATPVARRVGQEPASRLLERIVSTERRADRKPATPRPALGRARLAMAALAAVVAAGALTVGSFHDEPAYASWTPDPEPLPAADARQIMDHCSSGPEAGPERAALGERRGDYAYVITVAPSGSRTCFRDHDGKVRQASILTVLATSRQLGARGVDMYAWPQLATDEGYVRLMAGRVGTQVTAVDITVRPQSRDSARRLHATVRDGYFAAWYPEGREEANSNITTLTLHLEGGGAIGDLSASDLYENPKLD